MSNFVSCIQKDYFNCFSVSSLRMQNYDNTVWACWGQYLLNYFTNVLTSVKSSDHHILKINNATRIPFKQLGSFAHLRIKLLFDFSFPWYSNSKQKFCFLSSKGVQNICKLCGKEGNASKAAVRNVMFQEWEAKPQQWARKSCFFLSSILQFSFLFRDNFRMEAGGRLSISCGWINGSYPSDPKYF